MSNQNAAARNKNERRKSRNRRIAGVLAILLVAAMVLGAVLPFVVQGAQPEDSDSPVITITGELGFVRKYKIYGKTPVRLTVENKGEDFKGEIQILINQSVDTNERRDMIYAYPLELPSGGSGTVEMEINISVILTSAAVRLVDEDGVTVAKTELDAIAVEPAGLLIGALTSDRNALNYFRQMKFGSILASQSGTLDEWFVFLDESIMPDSLEVMNNFVAIVINNYDTGALSDEQIQALAEWVRTGGVLLLGSGPNYRKVFKALGPVVETSANGRARVSKMGDMIFSPEVTLERVEAAGGEVILSAGGEDLITAVAVGDGAVLIHNFDLGIAPIPDASRETGFLEQIFMPYLITAQGFKDSSAGFNYSVFYGSNIQLTDMGRINAIFVVIAVYCVIAGPVLYLILKRKDKREKALVLLPALSLAAVAVIGIISLGSDFRKPITTTNSLVTLDHGGGSGLMEGVTRAYSPSKGDVRVEFDRNVPIMPVDDRYYNYYGIAGGADEKKIIFGDKTGITFYKKEKWDANQFSSVGGVGFDGGITCDFTIDGGDLTGVITNTTDMDFYDVIVGFANDYQKYDFLGNNSTLEIKQPFLSSSMTGYRWSYPSQVYQTLYTNPVNAGLSVAERQKIRIRESMLDYFITNRAEMSMKYSSRYMSPSSVYSSGSAYFTAQSTGVISSSNALDTRNIAGEMLDVSVYCFNYDRLNNYELTINGREPSDFSVNLFAVKASAVLKPGSFIKLPAGMIDPYVEQGTAEFDYADAYGVYVTQGGEIEILFEFPGNMELSAFGVEWDSIINPLSMIETATIYNVRTGGWSSMNYQKSGTESLAFLSGDIEDYVDGEGILKIRTQVSANSYVRLPGISVEGTIVDDSGG